MQLDHVDISELPLLNTDLEVDGGFPPAVEAFRAKVRAADCFLFASPEYNYSIASTFLALSSSQFQISRALPPLRSNFVKDMMEPWLLNSAAHGLHVNIGRSTKDS